MSRRALAAQVSSGSGAMPTSPASARGTRTAGPTPGERRDRRLPPARRVGVAALLGLLGAGGALLAAGAWIPLKANAAQWLLNRAWAATDDDRRHVKPWPWADTWPAARLHLPRASEPLTVLAGASGRNLAFGPALLEGSAVPGAPGVSVIAGHRDTHFRALEALAVGERFRVERPDGATYAYDVVSIEIVDANTARLRLDAEEPTVALVTCYPFDAVNPGGDLRYVVIGVAAGPLGR
ncbi:MAG: class GN sortase [Gammaproteobacteria bacterium]|nr:class GN sortase [Gammaproteobacteria bacterium]